MLAVDYEAAWLPESDPQRASGERDEISIPFILDRAEREGRLPLLATRSKWDQRATPAMEEFAASYQTLTQQSSHRVRPRQGGGPVLALAPDLMLMELVMSQARGSVLLASRQGTPD